MRRRSSNLQTEQSNSKISTPNGNRNVTEPDSPNPFGETFSMTPQLTPSTPFPQNNSSVDTVNTVNLLFAPVRTNYDPSSTSLHARIRQLEDENLFLQGSLYFLNMFYKSLT